MKTILFIKIDKKISLSVTSAIGNVPTFTFYTYYKMPRNELRHGLGTRLDLGENCKWDSTVFK